MLRLQIGERWIGDGEPCFVIAEAGSNHNGSLEMALRLIDIAAEAGADAVKFQLFRAETLYPRSAGRTNYLKSPEGIYQIIEKMEMPEAWLPPLAARAHERGLLFGVSVFEEGLADAAEPYTDFFKIASYEMSHLPLIAQVGAKKQPTVLSTGTANLAEVGEAVETFRSTGNGALALMQCTAAYPAPLEALNLRAISTMRDAFNVPVGLSDHSRDPFTAPIAAVAMGAMLLEKHYTFSNDLPGPDHQFALEPDELREMIARVRQAESALGTGLKVPLAVEEELRQFARRTVFITRPVAPGEPLSVENTAILRAGRHVHGVPPGEWPRVLGRRAKRALAAETPLQWGDIEA